MRAVLTPVTVECDVRPGVLVTVMELTEPALWESAPGETDEDRLAREAARGDIVDDLLTEIASSPSTELPVWPLLDVEGWAA